MQINFKSEELVASLFVIRQYIKAKIHQSHLLYQIAKGAVGLNVGR